MNHAAEPNIESGAIGGFASQVIGPISRRANVLVGLPYLFARPSYAGELTIHFGEERGYGNPRNAGKRRGSHVVGVRGSSWMLRSGVVPTAILCGIEALNANPKPFNATALESGAFIKPGAVVSRVTPLAIDPMEAIGVSIELNDGSSILILPRRSDNPEADDLEDWEILSPKKILRVGPRASYAVEDFSAKT